MTTGMWLLLVWLMLLLVVTMVVPVEKREGGLGLAEPPSFCVEREELARLVVSLVVGGGGG